MRNRRISPAFAQVDPAHLFDGLFVPTRGQKRGRLDVPLRNFGKLSIGFQGYEELGADDQSVLLALIAQLGQNQLAIGHNPSGAVSRQLREAMIIGSDDSKAILATERTTLRSLLVDAGYHAQRSTADVKRSLNRLRSTQIREVDMLSGWDRVSHLVAVAYNHKTGDVFVAANPRLSNAIFHGQYIPVSLLERNRLVSDRAKILHCWLCSHIRLGGAAGNGNGVRLDSLASHVWGEAGWKAAGIAIRSVRRGQLRYALAEIADCTRELHNGYGWVVELGRESVRISRPKTMPKGELL